MATDLATSPSVIQKSQPTGRKWMWIGVILTIFGILGYMVLLGVAQYIHIPWYAPILATAGLGLVCVSLRQKFSVWRLIALLLVGGVAGFEWWFLLAHTKLPAYAGPVTVGQRFPEFTASLANGSPFTSNNFLGDKETVLIFFRGHW